MERQIPKNVRQIGNVSDSPKIYVEDYVDTFFSQLCEKCIKAGNGTIGAFLVGDMQKSDDDEYVYIYGAIQMHELKQSGSEYVIDETTWKRAYEDCKQFFDDGEMLGWFIVHPGVPLRPDAAAVKLHKRAFPKKNTVLIMKDPVEKDEAYFVHKMNDLMEIGGRYTYYEKNPCMQNYMIASRKKNGVFPSETVEDRAAQDFRNLARKRGQRRREKKPGSLIYAAGACMALVLVIMGVSMINSADRMKSVQSTLETLAGTENAAEISTVPESTDYAAEVQDGQEPGEPAEQTDQTGQAGEEPETQETSAAVAAAAPETELQADANEETMDGDDPADNGSDGVYVVEKGDTLAIISKKMYGDVNHVDAICRMNGISDGNLIYVGQKLLLP